MLLGNLQRNLILNMLFKLLQGQSGMIFLQLFTVMETGGTIVSLIFLLVLCFG